MTPTTAVTVYCGSSPGRQKAYQYAADCMPFHFHVESRSYIRSIALGKALATAKRQLVYGGAFKGIMGTVSGAALDAGGEVVGVVPYAIYAAGGETERVNGNSPTPTKMKEEWRERVGVICSLHTSSY